MRPQPIKQGNDGGYATVTAIILCAAISVLCAGILGLTMTEKRQADRQFFQTQQAEAINTAVLDFSTSLVRAQGDATISKDETVSWPGGRLTVKLRAEYEGRKWPIAKAAEIDEAVLAKYTSLPKQELEDAFSDADANRPVPPNDCLRSLFSSYGNTDPKKAFPQGVGLIASAGGHDGQVWRIRATTAGAVEERYVRFTGDSSHLFAVISQETFVRGQMPDCQVLRVVP